MENCITTANRLKIYTYRSDYLHSFCLNFYVRAGLMYEAEHEHGISHFWEHTVFKNIDRLYEGRLYELLDGAGLKFNGCTYKDFVYFSISGACSHFREGVDVITKILAPMGIDGKSAELERKRVKREIKESNDRTSLDLFTDSVIWKGTSLASTITGTAGSVNQITLRKLSEAHAKFLNTENVFFYVTGAFSDDDVDYLKLSAEQYRLPEKITERRLNIAPVPKDFGKRDGAVLLKNDDSTYVRFSFDIATEKYTSEELNLIYDIMFSGETARFYRTMSDENGLIYDYEALWDRYSNIGEIYFEFAVEQKNLYRALELISDIIVSMRENITDEDLKNVLPAYIDNGDLLLDDPPGLNWFMAYNHILGENVSSVDEDKKRYADVTPARLMQISNEIFTRDNFTFSAKCDLKKTDDKIIKNIFKVI